MTRPAPAPAQPGRTADSDPVHLVCCSDQVALCGEDMTGEVEIIDLDGHRICPACRWAYEAGLPCPVPRCRPRRRLRGRLG